MTAVAAIAALHLTAFAVALSMKGPGRDELPAAPPIVVTLASESHPVAAPELKVHLQELPVPVAPAPDVQINVPVEATAITMAVAPPPPAPPPADAHADADDGPVPVSKPDYLRMPSPVYPTAAKRARAQGVVHVRALVDAEGLPRDVRVERTSGFAALDKAACDAVLGALFKPYRRDNIARAMVVIVPVEFSLSVRSASTQGRRGGESQLDVGG